MGLEPSTFGNSLAPPLAPTPNDHDLARLCSAWSALPDHFKAAIMALVTAAR
jgi:hypothetical protein